MNHAPKASINALGAERINNTPSVVARPKAAAIHVFVRQPMDCFVPRNDRAGQ